MDATLCQTSNNYIICHNNYSFAVVKENKRDGIITRTYENEGSWYIFSRQWTN